ncbi:hypothetical protein SAY87_025141 [Trapa incisa]|uniref:Succinate dehydrogenase assembly factor 2, mitochondrial n=2 Tax=Trapa TaxID=22665 RepID=A0AAN7LKF7_TRANT|nr:hypothetical protein SAY87_025141 [Trapa incisa]KAK4788202.1 hypothetical protein SAY86_019521 [Trapa natans]
MASMRRAVICGLRIIRSVASTEEHLVAVSSPIKAAIFVRPQYQWAKRFSADASSTEHQSTDISFSSDENKRQICNRLLYRSKQRGFLELDLVLGKWVEEHIYSMDVKGIKSLMEVLDLENPDLWKWLSGQEQPPEAVKMNPVFCAIHGKVMNNLSSYSAPETRAIPGQPWVRGWDDIKKNQDGPVAGNQ